jgi:hypothetical protein
LVAAWLACGTSPAVAAKSPVKMTKLEGTVDLSAGSPFPYVLEGNASHLGKYEAYGEVEFEPGEEDGSQVGEGPVVFVAANGDLLVGFATWDVSAEADDVSEAHIHFAWRDSVEFSDGTIVANTGRFVKDRPPGLVVVAIVHVLVRLVLQINLRQ